MQGKSELLIPHASVSGVYSIDWRQLSALGFKGCVLDKDNTLTKPYTMALEPGVQQSLATCSREFQGNMVLLSNSAGAWPAQFCCTQWHPWSSTRSHAPARLGH